MDNSKPALVPEWLKNSGSLNSGGSTHRADDRATSMITRNKSFENGNGHDVGRFNADMMTSSWRSSSGNGSGHTRPYGSFGRNQRDKEWERDNYDSRGNGKIGFGNRKLGNGDYSDQLGSLSRKYERDGFRRSQSMISGTWRKKSATELSTAGGNNDNDLHVRRPPAHEVKKETSERDFSSLAEEKAVVSEGVRIPSPGLSFAIQNLPIGNGNTVAVNGEKWTSALTEVPPVLAGSNGAAYSSTPNSTSVVLNTTNGLNMAKTVAQGPIRAQPPELSAGTRRLEELAIKQSKQLIPVTPTLPKTLVVNTPDKHKTKLAQHHPPASSPLSITHSSRGVPLNGDASKGINSGRLHVLKPAWEKNGVIPVLKDTSSPTNDSKVASSTVTSNTRGPLNNPVFDRKPVLTVLEKRPTSQAQSRNDFFNQVRKKSMANLSSGPDSASISNPSLPAPDKLIQTPFSKSPTGDYLSEGSDKMTCNGSDGHFQDKTHDDACNRRFPEEEEVAFLRSMGWEENADEDGLTEEEICEFYRDVTKYVNLKPSLKILEVVRSKIGGIADGVSSGGSSSDAKAES